MGTGCSTEVSQAMGYDKSHLQDEKEKGARGRNRARRPSTTSSSDVNVKVNKPKSWTQQTKGSSYIPDQSDTNVERIDTRPSVPTLSSETDDKCGAKNFTHRDTVDIPSTMSIDTTVAPKIRDQWKMPTRLASLSRDLQDLLLGHHKEPSILINRPQVIHLKVIAPGEECMAERNAFWSLAFMPLRNLCAERGYVLDIHDDLWLSRNLERAYTHLLTLQGDVDDHSVIIKDELPVDILLIVLTDFCNYRLPPVLSYEDYTLVVVSLPDSVTTALFHDLYANNENRIPPAYELIYQVLIRQDEIKLTRLVNFMIGIFEREHKNTHIFNSDYYNQLISAQQAKTFLSESTVVVTRLCYDSTEKEPTCNQGFLERDKITYSHIAAICSYFEKECPPENCVQARNRKNNQGTGEVDLKEMALAVKDKLELLLINEIDKREESNRVIATGNDIDKREESNRVIATGNDIDKREESNRVIATGNDIDKREESNRVIATGNDIDKREESNRVIATGVPRSLIEELVTQTKHYQSLNAVEPLLKSPTFISLQDYVSTVSEMPIVVYAEAGWGLSTLGAQLVSSCMATMPTSVIIYRSMGISPDSRTLMSTLLSIRQQLDIILGPSTGTWSTIGEKQTPAVETLLGDIVSRSSNCMPLLIILEGISLASSQLKELDVMTMAELLPISTKLLVMTSDPDVARGLRTKMKDAFYVKASHWDKLSIMNLFTNRMNINRRTITDSQNSAVIAAINHCPLPMYAITTANIAASWRALTEISEDDLPSSLEGILCKLFEYLEHCIPSHCFSAMMAYLSISVGGISRWEMADLLSINDSALVSIYSDIKKPLIPRAPPILWRLVTAYLRNHLNVFLSKHFYIYSWTSSSFRKCAIGRYVNRSMTSTTLHNDMSDYFMGRWSNKNKLYPGHGKGESHLQDRFIMSQPDAHGKYFNFRKLMCLPFHLMNSKNKNAYSLETYIFNLPWIENKLNAVSVLQVVCDMEQAKLIDLSCVCEIKILQQALLQSSNILEVQGREIYKSLQYLMAITSGITEYAFKSQAKSSIGLVNFFAWLSSPPGSFLYPLDNVSLPPVQITNPSIPCPIIDTMIPVSNDFHEAHIVATLKSEQEIRVINIVTNKIVRTLTGVDRPQNLLMLDSTRAVVLCNRELSVIDLDKGRLLIKLRGVLNLRMPFFGLQNDQKVVALSRDRMVVNILDINTGGIVTTFKAGETRFLDSLIISGDGRVLVCGDETQKPFPLLVWSLEQCKLLHDIRMPQHEFMTQLAAITYNGQYLACGCREVNDSRSNFVAVYDLISGHLFKKFKMTALCTAVALASKTMCVLVALDTGQLAVWDLLLGSHKFLLDGARVVVNNIILTADEKMCLTTCKDDSSISSHTVSFWDLDEGKWSACHTFDRPVTCAQITPDGCMVLVGIKGHASPIRLLLVLEGRNLTTTNAEWETDKDAANAVFGDISRKDAIIDVAMDVT